MLTLLLLLIVGDILAKNVMLYASQEELNNSSKQALTEFAHFFYAIQDYRETEVR